MASSSDSPINRLNAALEGRYRIERELGEGGMATVYLAEDLRHERKVALKVLKPELAAVVGAERFLAEIKTTANLQHPHILPLFDSGQAESFLYYVMPYVEGDTLREKIDREKQLGVDEAVAIAARVASALDHAHKQGVVHRDIKPGNILLSGEGEPVVADFGIALAVAHAGGGRVTETGLSLGTPHYMSPEQATGDRDVDPRTDVYALGSILYEMLTGDPPYQGSTAQAVLGQIITGDPVSATKKRASVPANVDAAIRKALEKLPADRFMSAQEFSKALSDAGFRHGDDTAAGVAASPSLWNPLSGALAVGLAFAVALAAWLLVRPEAPRGVSRQYLSTGNWAGLEVPLGRYTALAPDGSSMILPVDGQLALKMRGSTEVTPIPGTEGGRDVVYSPNGQWIAYAVGNELFKRPLVGGAPVRLAEDTDLATVGLAWLDDETILYEQFAADAPRRILQIPEDGGDPLVVFPQEEVLASPVWAHGLPGARGALVTACQGTIACGGLQTDLYVVNLRDLSSELILEEVSRAWYTPTGHIVYVRPDGAVFAVPFDPGELEFTGSAIPLFDGVRMVLTGAEMRLGADGTLLYAEGGAAGSGLRTLVSVNRDGQEEPIRTEPQPYDFPRFSPDGDRLAVVVQEDADFDLWVFDLNRGSRSRVTFGGYNRYYPVWTPSGDGVAFSDAIAGSNTVHVAPSDGSGGIEPLLEREGLQYPTSWSRDGSVLAYHENHPETLRDLWVLPRDGDPEPFLATPFEEGGAVFSPDGRWLAYTSDRSGQQEIYVQPYPGPGPEFTVSTEGGREPLWSPDGSELFYRGPEQLMSVAVDGGEAFRAGVPRPLFADVYAPSPSAVASAHNYDVSPDGQRFVMVNANAEETEEGLAVILVQNFFEELRQVVPD